MTNSFRTVRQINVRARRFAAATALPLAALVLTVPLAAQDTASGHAMPMFAPADIKSEIAYLASDDNASDTAGVMQSARYFTRGAHSLTPPLTLTARPE